MKYFKGVALWFLVLVLPFGIQCVKNTYAAEKGDSTGWEKESDYNRLYRVDRYQKLKGSKVVIGGCCHEQQQGDISNHNYFHPGYHLIIVVRFFENFLGSHPSNA